MKRDELIRRAQFIGTVIALGIDLDTVLPDEGPFQPKDCAGCKYREPKQGGHCYMFRDQPRRRCGQRPPLPTSGKMPISTVPSGATAAVNSGNKASE